MVKSQGISWKPIARQEVVESEELLGQELFLYDQTKGEVHTLNSGAAMVWLLCDGSRNLEDISAEIASVNGLSEDETLPQVREAVAQYEELGRLQA